MEETIETVQWRTISAINKQFSFPIDRETDYVIDSLPSFYYGPSSMVTAMPTVSAIAFSFCFYPMTDSICSDSSCSALSPFCALHPSSFFLALSSSSSLPSTQSLNHCPMTKTNRSPNWSLNPNPSPNRCRCPLQCVPIDAVPFPFVSWPNGPASPR